MRSPIEGSKRSLRLSARPESGPEIIAPHSAWSHMHPACPPTPAPKRTARARDEDLFRRIIWRRIAGRDVEHHIFALLGHEAKHEKRDPADDSSWFPMSWTIPMDAKDRSAPVGSAFMREAIPSKTGCSTLLVGLPGRELDCDSRGQAPRR